jgi:hypothetical protein
MPFSVEDCRTIEGDIAELWALQDVVLRSLNSRNVELLIQINLEIDVLEVQLSALLTE